LDKTAIEDADHPPRLYFKKGETPAEFLAEIIDLEERERISTTYTGEGGTEICVEILDAKQSVLMDIISGLRRLAGSSYLREEYFNADE
jgi:hypothetical protein